ncbi:hypothetical protein ACS0TY_006057 [Phlomoides rotata]
MGKMMKINLSLVVVFLLLVLSTTSTAAEEEEEGCNASRIGECLADEFLMESETSRRVLAGGGKRIQPLIPQKPFCDARVYNNCNGGPNDKFKKRPCNYTNTCKRPGK